jgi:sortase A
MLSLRSADQNLRVTGAILFAVYFLSELSGFFLSRTGAKSYTQRGLVAGQALERSANGRMGAVDFALWSQKRIEAYKHALQLRLGAPVALLSIPRIGIDEVPVFEGTDDLTLNRGAGLISGMGRPGRPGNVGIAAHRDGFFRGLKDIKVGDQIELNAGSGEFAYKVEDIEIVDPGDVSVLKSRSKPSLTLVTCYPFYFAGDAPMRYIVHAALLDLSKAASRLAIPTSNAERQEAQ